MIPRLVLSGLGALAGRIVSPIQKWVHECDRVAAEVVDEIRRQSDFEDERSPLGGDPRR
jgi:hypothetical protein